MALRQAFSNISFACRRITTSNVVPSLQTLDFTMASSAFSLEPFGRASSFHSTAIPFSATATTSQSTSAAVSQDASAVKNPPHWDDPSLNSLGGKAGEPLAMPWTFTKDLTKIKHYTKRMKFLVQTIEKENVEGSHYNKFTTPDFQPGDILKLKICTPENLRRVSYWKGICIARSNKGFGTSFRVRNVVNGVGVERMFPLHSPNLLDVEKVGRIPGVRRAKLYYLREKGPKYSKV